MEKYCMKLPEIANEWLQKAQEDYGFACVSLEDTEYCSDLFSFPAGSRKISQSIYCC